jgi:3-hydroxybutyrate dehydrogenase
MLQGKVALITGSLSGIGFEISMAFAKKGCAIVLNGLGDPALIENQLLQIKDQGVDAIFIKADLSVPDEIEDMVSQAMAKMGKIDILVNNAVSRFDAVIENLPPEKWSYAMAVNLSAPYHLSRLILPSMKSRNWGRIINLASIYGVEGVAGRTDYVVTKHGLVGMTKVIALECAEFNITCNALCPGAVETPFIKELVSQRAAKAGSSTETYTKEFLQARQPSKRFVQPSSVAALALFLCSEEAKDMTGTPIAMDGGWQARA